LANTCANKNPFLEGLKAKGVVIFNTPQANFRKCGTEWTNFKTCCDESTLTTYAEEDRKAILGLTAQMQDEVSTVEKALTSIKNNDPTSKLPNQDSPLKKAINKFLDVVGTMLRGEIGRPAFVRCNTRLADFRSASLCNTCSGRSQRYFSQDGRAYVSLKDCRLVVDDCTATWSTMINVVDAVKSLKLFVEEIKRIDPKFNEDTFKNTENLDSWIKDTQIREHLQNCKSNSNASCDDNNAIAICQNLVTFQLAPTKLSLSNIINVAALKQLVDTMTKKFLESSFLKLVEQKYKPLPVTRDIIKNVNQVFQKLPLWDSKKRRMLLFNFSSFLSGLSSKPAPAPAPAPVASKAAPTAQTTTATSVMMGEEKVRKVEIQVRTADYTAATPESSMNLSIQFP